MSRLKVEQRRPTSSHPPGPSLDFAKPQSRIRAGALFDCAQDSKISPLLTTTITAAMSGPSGASYVLKRPWLKRWMMPLSNWYADAAGYRRLGMIIRLGGNEQS
jgi:hypothetical protein